MDDAEDHEQADGKRRFREPAHLACLEARPERREPRRQRVAGHRREDRTAHRCEQDRGEPQLGGGDRHQQDQGRRRGHDLDQHRQL
jgi:hypothetical protein